MLDPETFRLRRTIARATQRDLAARTRDISNVKISLFESGKRRLSESECERLEAALRAIEQERLTTDPGAVAMIDGKTAADRPGLLILEARALCIGGDGILERLRTCVDAREAEVLTRLVDLTLERLAEIRTALSPYKQVPS